MGQCRKPVGYKQTLLVLTISVDDKVFPGCANGCDPTEYGHHGMDTSRLRRAQYIELKDTLTAIRDDIIHGIKDGLIA